MSRKMNVIAERIRPDHLYLDSSLKQLATLESDLDHFRL